MLNIQCLELISFLRRMCLTDPAQPMTNISLTRINSTKSNTDEILHVIYDYESKGDDELTLK